MSASFVGRTLARAGLDEQVLSTLLFRGWSTIAGALTVVLMPLWLSPTEQGYYYTFGSVLALQIFFELGLNQIVMQLASHEVAHLEMAADGSFTGAAAQLGRLSSLAKLLRFWYLTAAVLFFVVGGSAGAVFFATRGTMPMQAWLGVWSLLVGSAALNLWFSPSLALLEGLGRLGNVARLRLKQSLLGYACLWLLLACGAGLWSVISIPACSALCTGLWLQANGQGLRWLNARVPDLLHRLAWRVDVLPLQWRIAVSWISGFFIFNLFTPLVFSHQGAVEAGRIGMALNIFTAASAIGMSWVNAKAPMFTMYVSRGERASLNAIFRHVALRSTLFTALVCTCIVVGAIVMTWLGVPLMKRLAPPPVLAVLALVTIVNSMVFAAATYMRAHREEPMLATSVVTGILTGLAAWYGARLGLLPMMSLYLAVSLFVSVPWTAALFVRYYRRTC